MKNVYLDNNATTMVAGEVIEAMMPFFERFWANPSSMHTFGGQVKQIQYRRRHRLRAATHPRHSQTPAGDLTVRSIGGLAATAIRA